MATVGLIPEAIHKYPQVSKGQSLQKARTFFIILMMCNNMYHMF